MPTACRLSLPLPQTQAAKAYRPSLRLFSPAQILKIAKRNGLPIELPLVEEVVARLPNAANVLVETLYTHFTHRV